MSHLTEFLNVHKTAFFFLPSSMSFSEARGMLDLKKTTDFGKTLKLIAMKIYSFVARGRFLFATVMKNMVSIHNKLFIPQPQIMAGVLHLHTKHA